MAAEIQWSYSRLLSGYASVRSSSGTIFNRATGLFEAYTAANYLDYQLSGREQSSGGVYVADFPSAITTPGYYNIVAREQVAGSGLQSDLIVAEGELWWNGGAVIIAGEMRSGHMAVSGVQPASGFATSVQVSGLATYANISGITQAFVSGALFASGGAVGWLLSGKESLSGIIANSGIFIQSGYATAVQVSGIATGFAFVSGVQPASGFATAVQVSGVATYANISGINHAFTSGTITASGFATAVQVSGLAPWASVSGLYAFLPIRLTKGRSFNNFPFPFYGSGTTTGITSGTPISGQISKNGGAFGLLESGSFVEIGFGWYNCQFLTSGDLNADSIALRFNLSGADLRDITIVLQPG